MWLRNVGGHTRFRDSSGQLKTQSNRYVLQIGGDVAQWSSDEVERWHLGVMFGYANSQSNTRSDVSHYRADGSISGYSAGLYATRYANNVEKSGDMLTAGCFITGLITPFAVNSWRQRNIVHGGDRLA